MAPSPLLLASHAFATTFIAFGINALLRPANALTFFEWTHPTTAADAQLVDGLLAVYGVRDIFMGLAIFASALCGTRKSTGWTLVAAGAVAVADGVVCGRFGGIGAEWNHWGYA